MSERKHLVESAGYWFNAARKAQDEKNFGEAVFFMEQAYNHVENALAYERRPTATSFEQESREVARMKGWWDPPPTHRMVWRRELRWWFATKILDWLMDLTAPEASLELTLAFQRLSKRFTNAAEFNTVRIRWRPKR